MFEYLEDTFILDNDDLLYLEVKIFYSAKGWETLSPREWITSTAFAIKATSADVATDADTVDGFHGRSQIMYNYKCEYCKGTVKEKLIKKEILKHKSGFVMLEDVPIDICDNCGYRYYNSIIIQRVEEIANGNEAPERTEKIPVAHVNVN